MMDCYREAVAVICLVNRLLSQLSMSSIAAAQLSVAIFWSFLKSTASIRGVTSMQSSKRLHQNATPVLNPEIDATQLAICSMSNGELK